MINNKKMRTHSYSPHCGNYKERTSTVVLPKVKRDGNNRGSRNVVYYFFEKKRLKLEEDQQGLHFAPFPAPSVLARNAHQQSYSRLHMSVINQTD